MPPIYCFDVVFAHLNVHVIVKGWMVIAGCLTLKVFLLGRKETIECIILTSIYEPDFVQSMSLIIPCILGENKTTQIVGSLILRF